jgi:hypothetical protein
MADERFDVVGQAGEAMTLLEQEVTGRPGGDCCEGRGGHCQRWKGLPMLQNDYIELSDE